MNETIANTVHSVIDYGLRLRGYLDSGNSMDLETEQAKLLDLLMANVESIDTEDSDQHANDQNTAFNDRRRMTNNFLGIRYALVCWLDEIFTNHEQCRQEWTEHKLEGKLYGTNDRAWKFWQQAKTAATRNDHSLEAFYLCVNLGFRGDLRDQPEKLRAWVNQTKLRLGKVDELEFPFSTERSFQNVPSLTGAAKFRKMAFVCWAALLVVVPLVSFVLIRKFGE